MQSSNQHRVLGFSFTLLVVSVLAFALPARAEQQGQGFALSRFYASAAGGGWFVMDALDMHGGLGGAMALTASYARNPLRITNASQQLAVVSDQALMGFGFAITYERFRLYLNLDAPLVTKGQSGTLGDYKFSAPSIGLGSHPDLLSDARVGVDVRIIGSATSPFRLGVGAQLIVPNSEPPESDNPTVKRPHYDTDGTYRAMGRILFAGEQGLFTYAGQLGVHVRPLDDSPIPGSPQGSEVLFGVAGGAKLPVGSNATAALIVGPELYGATAFRSFLGSTGTSLEGLLTGRIEGTSDERSQLRVKLGVGAGLAAHFGAPEWRLMLSVEVFGRGKG